MEGARSAATERPLGGAPAATAEPRGAVPDEAPASEEMRVFGGVAVARRRFPPGEYVAPPASAGHLVTLHLNGPVPGTWQPAQGRARGYVEARGDVIVVPAGTGCRQAPHAESEDLSVLVPDGFLRRVAGEAGADPDRLEVLHRFCARDEQAERLMLSFLPEIETGGLGGELYAQGLANALAVHLLRHHSSLGERARRGIARGPAEGSGLSARALKAATDYVGDNLAGELSLAELAAQANLSPYYFSRLFKRSTGVSPHQYVVRERVRKAKELLLRGGLPVAAVAREVGFADQGHLSRHTKRLLGATPGEILAEGKAERGGAAGGGAEEGKNLRNQSKILQDPAALPV